ncbi:MAG: 1-acyl-sn-glycerol-3-phosphate acyltransferase [Austwickia sp.]|nr:1-acyl-sn-glycerol-3-phosphate acyltransferase [Actinomycetota bacterium]MCO5308118.1 1-acyl-sn-glycerol-3-phosphate acyltransferase [Austwickia sp.]
MDRFYRAVVDTGHAVFAMQGLRFRMTGVGNIPRTGPAVMVLNHTNYLDFMFGGLVADAAGRYVRFMCKESIFRHPIGGPFMRAMKHIPVDRDAGAASFATALRALKQGEIVGVFPEATISRSFELKEFKSGAVRMAQASGAPLLPVVSWGGQRIWSKGKPKRLGRTKTPVGIRIGEPYVVPKGQSPEDANAELKRRMQELLDAEQRDYPALTGADLQFLPHRLGGTAPTLEEARELETRDAERRRQERAARIARKGRS